MFRPEEILERLRGKPFLPVRIIVDEGLHYDIYHPDLVLVGDRFLEIGLPSSKNPLIFDTIVRVAILHVVALEDIPTAKASSDGVAGS